MTPILAASSPATPVKSALARAAEATPIQPSSPYIGNPTQDVKYDLKPAATRTKQASTPAATKQSAQPAPPQEEPPSIIAVEVVVEEVETGMSMLRRVLVELGYSEDEAREYLRGARSKAVGGNVALD